MNEKETAAPSRLHVLLNPMSGKRKARSIFQQVRPLLEKSYPQLRVTETTASGHAQKIVQDMDLSEVAGLVAIGGDGTIYEAINGLMSRADWQTAIKTPIGVIPAGTGNGLVKTLLEISGQAYDPIGAAFLIARGQQRPLDLVMIEQEGRRYYSALSLSWAFISDVDIESDRLRFLGSLKNDIYALLRIWNLRTYPGRFSFFPASEPARQVCKPFLECSCCSSEMAALSDLQPIAQDGRWQVLEGEFVVFWAMNVAWAAHNLKAAPHAHLSDGAIDVLVVRRGISKWQLLSAFLSSAKGGHICSPHVDYYKVRSFRLEPLTSRGILAVDGERVNYSPVQVQVLRGLARVFSH